MANMTKKQLEEKAAGLEKELCQYKEWLNESERKYTELMDERELKFKELPLYMQMEREIETSKSIIKSHEYSINRLEKKKSSLEGRIQELLEENRQLKEAMGKQQANVTEHNPRNAGRKPKPEAILKEQLNKMDRLAEEGRREKDICTIMGISRSTYYRLKKILKYQ